MQTIYVVQASPDEYEPYENVRAYVEEEKANAFKVECERYSVSQPTPWPRGNRSQEEYRRWIQEFETWTSQHPAGKDYAGFKFIVESVELY